MSLWPDDLCQALHVLRCPGLSCTLVPPVMEHYHGQRKGAARPGEEITDGGNIAKNGDQQAEPANLSQHCALCTQLSQDSSSRQVISHFTDKETRVPSSQ